MGGTNWPTTSVRLVSALQRPDDQLAWQRFSNEYGPALFEFCRRRGVQPADADDIVQLVYCGAHRTVKNVDITNDQGRFRSWLSTIALRAIWKLRARRQADRCEYIDPKALDDFEAEQRQLTRELNEVVLALAIDEVRPSYDELTWNAFSAVWFDRESPQVVAERLSRPIGWVYNVKCRVLQRVKGVVRRMAHELDEF